MPFWQHLSTHAVFVAFLATFAEPGNHRVKLEKKINTISGKAFLHCKSIEYIGYDYLPGKVCWDNDKFAMEIGRAHV